MLVHYRDCLSIRLATIVVGCVFVIGCSGVVIFVLDENGFSEVSGFRL